MIKNKWNEKDWKKRKLIVQSFMASFFLILMGIIIIVKQEFEPRLSNLLSFLPKMYGQSAILFGSISVIAGIVFLFFGIKELKS